MPGTYSGTRSSQPEPIQVAYPVHFKVK